MSKERVIETKTEEVKTLQVITELVEWDGVIRATFTTSKVLPDKSQIPVDTVTTSRVAASDPAVDAWLAQGYQMAAVWLAEDLAKVKNDEAVGVAVKVP